MTDRPGVLIPLARLYENTSAKTGNRYFTGYPGKAKLVMLEAKDAKPGEPQRTPLVAERLENPAAGGRDARLRGRPGGAAAWHRTWQAVPAARRGERGEDA